MREILFRGKRIDNGEWVEGGFCNGNNRNEPIICPKHDFSTEVIPETVGQYTGLTDKNGKKIFEGDIIDAISFGERIRYVVSFSEDRCGWYPFACGDGCGCCESDVRSPECCEVIGNIHDNPELLKGADDERY